MALRFLILRVTLGFLVTLAQAQVASGADECTTVTTACKNDADCLSCLNTEAAPITCATTATTCSGWWAMACCIYGNSDACLTNTLLVSHLQCLAEGNDCTIDGVCPADNGQDDGGSSSADTGSDDADTGSDDEEEQEEQEEQEEKQEQEQESDLVVDLARSSAGGDAVAGSAVLLAVMVWLPVAVLLS